ncbi:CRISPR-associated endonuclease Cas2 [Colwellia sp. 12G3]|uniref:CRISPR-associated endonuclease Cas2 n=1 Tax=Colwellia sp. 12G3 TaxID=2058299 RepID=UPI000C34E846|nr:CRISPR-associated endonuclease Cas2 [Colwellia sp. 12G3]PKI12724.1 CRISPR-associated endonuclease Cas2 [Colwellia sp. 12G3]
MPQSYLICYDIRNPKRLQKVHKVIIHYGVLLQFSVYYGLMEQHTLKEMVDKLITIINDKEDDIRIYPIHGSTLENWPKEGFSGNDKFLLLN